MPAFGDEDDEYYKAFKCEWLAAPFDARYPHMNQYPKCLRNYIDYHRCKKIKGDDFMDCNYFRKTYRLVCHSWMIQRWDEQREKGIFEYKI